MSVISTRFQIRRDTSSNWTSVNPELLPGELGLETNTGKIKLGNGNRWNTVTNYIADAGVITAAQTATTTLNSKLANFISVKDYGAFGDGTSHQLGATYTLAQAQAYYGNFVTSVTQQTDWAAIQKAVNTGGLSVYIPAGTYILGNDPIRVNSSNLQIYGTGATTILTSTARANIIELQTCSNVSFTDIALTGNVNTSGEDGVISTTATSVIRDITFERCNITTSSFGTNGGYFPATVDEAINNLRFMRCNFSNIGRHGIEVTNNSDSTSRYRGVVVEQCRFTNISGSSRACVLLNGYGNQNVISSNIFNNVLFAIQLQGASDTSVNFNKFQAFATGGCPFKFNGTIEMNRNVVTGNTTEASASGDTEFNLQRALVLSGNYLVHSGNSNIKITDSDSLRASDEIYVTGTTATSTCLLTGPATDSRFINCKFDSSANTSGSAFSVSKPTNSSGVINTMFTNSNFTIGSGGSVYTTSLGAGVTTIENPQFYLSKRTQSGTTSILQNDPIPVGNNWRNSITKLVGAGNTNSIAIDLGSSGSGTGSGSSVPACISIKAVSVDTSGNNYGFIENRYWIRHQGTGGSATVTLPATSTIVNGSNLALTTVQSGQVITITATNTTGSGSLQFMWDIDIDSVNVPIVV